MRSTSAWDKSKNRIKIRSMEPTLAEVEDLARRAGAILRAYYQPRPGFGSSLHVRYKGEIDPVTEADHKTEAFLLAEIQGRFPGHSILSEESGDLPGSQEHQWILDPLDGTINFTRGLPIFVVSIAYAEQGAVRIGAVYDPVLDECFSAERDRGAFLNGEPIRVSEVKQLGRSLLATGFPYDVRTNPENNLDQYARGTMQAQALRHMGAAARDLVYVAAGRLDGYWELRISPWDVAAGGLIAEQAGATVTKVGGDPRYLLPPYSILAANPHIYPQLISSLKGN